MTLSPDIRAFIDREDALLPEFIRRIAPIPYRDKEDIDYDLSNNDLGTRNSNVVGLSNELEPLGVDLRVVRGVESIRRWVHKVLRVEPSVFPIFSTSYGFELLGVIGQDIPVEAIENMLPGFLHRALTYHPNISNVTNVQTYSEKDRLFATFNILLDDENIIEDGFSWDIT